MGAFGIVETQPGIQVGLQRLDRLVEGGAQGFDEKLFQPGRAAQALIDLAR